MKTYGFNTAKQFIHHMLQQERTSSIQYRFICSDGFLITHDIERAHKHGWGEYEIDRIECKVFRHEMLYRVFVKE
ncbi:MAG: hypothetical protein ACRC17_05710 [Culicoidibacterales bacterium]